MRVYISPSGQAYNKYAAGNTTEAEQCRRIGNACFAALLRSGVEVKISPPGMPTDNAVIDSNNYKPDYHVCIHTNAISGDNSKPSAQGAVVFTSKKNIDSPVAYAVLDALNTLKGKKSLYGVRPNSLYEINRTTAKCIYIEAEFHDNAELALWIIDNAENIGEAIAEGICVGCGIKFVPKESETAKYRRLAIEQGIVKGFEDGDYRWGEAVTRSQLCTILGRLGLLNE